MRKYGVLLAVIIVAGMVAACQPKKPAAVKIVIAMSVRGSVVGQSMEDAAHLAIDESGGKAGDVVVEAEFLDVTAPEDNPTSLDPEIEAAKQAAADPAVVAYIGCASSARAKAAIPILNRAGIVTLSPSATWPGLTKPGFAPGAPGEFYPSGSQTFFRVASSDDVQGGAAARWAARMGMQRIYIVDNENVCGQTIAGIFDVAAKDEGLEIVGRGSYNGSDVSEAEIAALADEIVAAQPDVVYLGASRVYGGGEMLSALRQRDASIQVLVPDGMVKDQLMQEYPAAVTEGVYGTNITLPAELLTSDQAKQFVAAYKEAYGKIPTSFAVNTYEEVKVVLYAIAHAASPDRAGVLDAIRNLGEYSGVLGKWSFTNTGDIDRPLCSGWQIQNGAWKFVQVLK